MKTVALGDLATINPREARLPPEVAVSFVGMAQLDAEAAMARPLATRRFGEVSTGYTVFRDGDLLAAKITPCWENGKVGQAALDNQIGVGSSEFHVVRPTPDADARYLLHFLRQPSVRIAGEARMTGSAGQKRVPVAFLQDLRVPLPDLREQRRIAAILDQADALRAKRRQMLAKLSVLTTSMFHSVATDCHQVALLGDHIVDGPTNGLYRPSSDYGSGTPILRIDTFGLDGMRKGDWKRVRIDPVEQQRYSLGVGDIVVNRVNALAQLGKAVLIEEIAEVSVYESNMMRIRVDEARLIPRFVAHWFQSPAARRQILARAKEAINQASINQTDVRELKIPVPSMKAQRRFDEQLMTVDRYRRRLEENLSNEEELFASLQARAFADALV